MLTLANDTRHGYRQLKRDPGFAVTAILTLAICLGANAALFTLVNSVLLRPLPVPNSDRMVVIADQFPKAGMNHLNVSGPTDYADRMKGVPGLDAQAMFTGISATILIEGKPERMRAMAATPSLFRLLTVQPFLGRTFTPEEGEAGRDKAVVLSYGLWQEVFGADRGVIGREIRVSEVPRTIVGVMPQGFQFLDPKFRLWLPLTFTEKQTSDANRYSDISYINIGRMKPGVTIPQIESQIGALNASIAERFPASKGFLDDAGFYVSVEPMQDMVVRDIRPTLYLLWGGAVFVLLIGAMNLTNVVTARSGARLKEMATRVALGATREDILRQLLIESLIVTTSGAVAGLGFAQIILRELSRIGLEGLPRISEVHMDGTVVAFTLVLACLTGFVIAWASAAGVVRTTWSQALQLESRSATAGRRTRRLRRALVASQVGVACLLLVAAGLLLASFRELLRVKPGFTVNGVLTAGTQLPDARYTTESAQRQFMERTLTAFRAIPGVTAVGATSHLPFSSSATADVIVPEGYVMKPGEPVVAPRRLTITPGYLESMNIPLVRGRFFTNRDTDGAVPAIIIDARLAQRFWPGQDPLGKRMFVPEDGNDTLKPGPNVKWLTIVGIVPEVRMDDLEGNLNFPGSVYYPYDQTPQNARAPFFTIKTNAPESIAGTVRSRLAEVDSELPLFDVRTLEEITTRSLQSRRIAMFIAIAYGAVALLLAGVGIYGVLAYLVVQRRREIGIRMALGSTVGGIFRLVLGEGLTITVAGLVLGLAAATQFSSVIEGEIYGIQPLDPFVLAAAVLVLTAIALAACIVPALRASRVDPVIVLNE